MATGANPFSQIVQLLQYPSYYQYPSSSSKGITKEFNHVSTKPTINQIPVAPTVPLLAAKSKSEGAFTQWWQFPTA